MKNDIILMGHGGGGGLTKQLIDEIIVAELGNPVLAPLDDGACFPSPGENLVMTTDSYVIDPIVFPGGDIGGLAVCGTVNDLAMQGARPVCLSLALIIEEGLPVSELATIVRSVGETARAAGVDVVTGDTKVVEGPPSRHGEEQHGGIFINTTGLGVRPAGVDTSVANAVTGDVVLVTGTLGDHGMAIMNRREGLGLESTLVSDMGCLAEMIGILLEAVPEVHCLRDPTRGGLAAALCDVASSSKCCIRLDEKALPVRDEVRGACSLLGMEPLNVANEGKAVVVCPADLAEKALEVLRGHEHGREACKVGEITAEPPGMVLLRTTAGGERIVDVPTGEDLPRIC